MPPFLSSHKAVFSLGLSNSLVCYQLGPQLVNLCRCDWIANVFSSSVGLPTDEFIGKWTIRRWEPGWSNECLWRGYGSPETLSIPLVWNKQPCSITPPTILLLLFTDTETKRRQPSMDHNLWSYKSKQTRPLLSYLFGCFFSRRRDVQAEKTGSKSRLLAVPVSDHTAQKPLGLVCRRSLEPLRKVSLRKPQVL